MMTNAQQDKIEAAQEEMEREERRRLRCDDRDETALDVEPAHDPRSEL